MKQLIKGGKVVDVERGTWSDLDVVIDDGVILEVGHFPELDADIIDAADTAVLPGFVDTHRHLWVTVLRSTTVDLRLPDYLTEVTGRLAQRFTPEDVRASGYFGALEALSSGITTLYDFAHLQPTPAHADAILDYLGASGLRAVLGYAHPGQRRDDVLRRLAEHQSDSITLSLAALGPVWGSLDDTVADWRIASELGIGLSMHAMGEGAIERLDELGLLAPNLLVTHGNGFTDAAVARMADAGVAASITPAVELLMGHGIAETERFLAAGVPTGFGIDVVTSVPGDMFATMRAALLADRLVGGRLLAADVLRIATTGGASALRLSQQIGAIRPGLAADLQLVRLDGLAVAPATDVIGAIVGSAGPADVDTVMVGGRIVKRHGRLTADVDAARAAAVASGLRITSGGIR